MSLKVRDLMTESVITLDVDEDLSLAEEVMKLGRIRHLPVVNGDNELVGLITHRDLLRASVSSIAELTEAEDKAVKRSLSAGEIMNEKITTISPNDTALTAAQMMKTDKIGCLPVVDDSQLVGIITEADFLDLVIRALSPEGKGDETFAGTV